MRADSQDPVRQYGLFALVGTGALAVFISAPASYLSLAPLAVFGFMAMYQAVSNTSRTRLLADPAYQARLQSIATMVFWIGSASGQLWGGIAVDRFGVTELLAGSAVLLARWRVDDARRSPRLATTGMRLRLDREAAKAHEVHEARRQRRDRAAASISTLRISTMLRAFAIRIP
jgi:hypothetical protein